MTGLTNDFQILPLYYDNLISEHPSITHTPHYTIDDHEESIGF